MENENRACDVGHEQPDAVPGGPVRVLQAVGGMDAGGIETFLMSVYRAIDRSKVQFDFLESVEKPCFYDDEIRELGGRIYKMRQARKNIPETNKKLLSFFGEHPEYRVAHFHKGHLDTLMSTKAAKTCGVPTRIVHAHCANPRLRLSHKCMHYVNVRRVPSLCTDMFACSRAAAEYFGFDVTNDNAWRYVPNGIDVGRFAFSEALRNDARAELGFSEGDPVVGMVGRFSPQKNQSFGIEAFKRFHDKAPQAKLLIVSGGGPLEDEVFAQVAELGLQDCVTVLKNRKDTERLYCAMDVFLFPSLWEGLGIVLVEAQASGLPCVISEAVPKEGIVCPETKVLPFDVGADAWAEELMAAVSFGRIPDGAAQVAAAGFDIHKVAENLADFYLNRSGER